METPMPNYGVTDSLSSSPRTRAPETDWDEPLPPVPGAKLRLMCSYGGHIIPRPHDKSLCYVGGETRLVVAERKSSLSEFLARLSHTLLDGRKFGLKYQLPNEDLDSLISVATNEDLENMIEEYDRVADASNNSSSASTSSGSRIRLFLFLAKPETAQTMGTLLTEAQSETWFVDALNRADDLSRGFSDSAAGGDLMRLDSDLDLQFSLQCIASEPKLGAYHSQDVHSMHSVIMSDSPMFETNSSSFDSSASSPSMAHLPPIRVPIEDVNDGVTRSLDENKGGRAAPPHTTSTLAQPSSAAVVANCNNATMIVKQSNDGNISGCATVFDDDSLPEQGGPTPFLSRKPPLPLTLQQRTGGSGCNDFKNAATAGFSLPSPDSTKSDSSIASGMSATNTTHNQEQAQVTTSNENNPSMIQQNTEQTSSNNQNNQQQSTPQDPNNYMYLSQHPDQHHQFIQENMHYIPTHPQIPPPYRTVYATPQQIHPHQVDHPQQYPMYLLPVPQTQPYNLPHQPTSLGPNSSVSAHGQTSVYPASGGAPPQNAQFHQYLGYNTSGHQPMTRHPVNYGHIDYGHNQVYYTGQVPAAPVAAPVATTSQYQSLTPAQAATIAEASLQLPNAQRSNQYPTS